MGICDKCGSNMPAGSGICQQCGYRNIVEGSSTKPLAPTPPPRVVNKPLTPPPLAKHNPGKAKAAQLEDDNYKKSNSNKKIIFAFLLIIIAIVGVLIFKKIIAVDYDNKVNEQMENITSAIEPQSQEDSQDKMPAESLQELQVDDKSSQDIKAVKSESSNFKVENYLLAISAKQWDRVESLIGLSEITPPIKGNRKSARKLNEEALVELRGMNFDKAIEILTRAVSEDESDYEILNNLGFAQTKIGDYASAKSTYLKTLSYAPTRSITWGNLAEIYANENRADLAYTALQMQVYVANDRRKVIDSLQKIATSSNLEVRNSKLSEIINAHLNNLSELPERD